MKLHVIKKIKKQIYHHQLFLQAALLAAIGMNCP